MWIKNNVFLEQPLVKFGYDLVLVLEVRFRPISRTALRVARLRSSE